MDLALDEAQELLKNAAKEFMERECPRTLVRRLDESATGFSSEIWQKMVDLGWVGALIPTQYGGGGRSLLDVAVLYEEMGRALCPSPHFSSAVLSALAILEAGSEQQKSQILPPVAQGQQILALAVSEQEYGWTPDAVQMRATRRNGSFVLEGEKSFVPDAQIASQILCVARTGEGRDEAEGLTLFLVDRNTPGLSVRTLTGFTGDKLNVVSFSSVAVPESRVIGQVDRAWGPLSAAMEKATGILCAFMVGGCQQVYEIARDYARTRIQFGQAIGNFQRVQDHVINALNHADAARWTTYEAIWKLDADKAGASEAISMAKAVASEGFHEACFFAHEVCGGIGTSKEFGLYLYTQRARSLYHYLGDPAYHRERIAQLLEM